MPTTDALAEADRILHICNACRYCEGYCAVFPAMERRLDFSHGDLRYLANLCHNCNECFHACQYAPPHEFAVNVTQVLAAVRTESYRHYAWPRIFGKAFGQNGLLTAIIAALVLNAFFVGAMVFVGNRQLLSPTIGGDFYRLIPHSVMMLAFGGVSLFIVLALLIGAVRCWRDSGERFAEFFRPSALRAALKDALTLTYLHGSGEDCVSETSDRRLPWRRYFHHCAFYGFLLCFAATIAAAIYHYGFRLSAPYAYTSVPVVLGVVGGAGLLIGPIGLLLLGARAPRDREQRGMGAAFIALLSLASLTGFLLLALRQSAMLGVLLVVHLALVMALFVMLPYGQFVHGVYRFLALTRYASERRGPRAGG